MNDDIRALLRFVCSGDEKNARQQAQIILKKITTQRDQRFRDDMLRRLESRAANLMQLPSNLQGILISEGMENFPASRFLLRPAEAPVVDTLLASYRAAGRLEELGIQYLPSLILHGQSGTGKTMLARYIAYRAGLPFVYVRFSALIGGTLGQTGGNLNRIFTYVKGSPCVLCIDEIDAIGSARGCDGNPAASEMSRATISLMQELDTCPNSVLVVGTTNRLDALDDALTSRFSSMHEVLPLNEADIKATVELFFDHVGVPLPEPVGAWCERSFGPSATSRHVVRRCTEQVVDYLSKNPAVSTAS